MAKSVTIFGEGNYPFTGGGVSTWCHSLCRKLHTIKFSLFSITAQVHEAPLYELPSNIENVTQFPIWNLEEPGEIFNYHERFFDKVLRKEATKTIQIRKDFLPLLDKLLNAVFYQEKNAALITDIYIGMQHFFVQNDYKITMHSQVVWEFYKSKIETFTIVDPYLKDITVMDMVIVLRWMYRFLLPMSIEVSQKDVSHVTISGFPILPALMLKHKFKTPIILTEHGVFIRERLISMGSSNYSYFLKKFLVGLSETITRVAYFNADVIVSVNKYNLKWAKIYGADEKKCRVIYNGVDEKTFTPLSPSLEEKLFDSTQFTVVAAARIFELKDIITMIKVCGEVKKIIPKVKFVVYGEKNAVPEYTLACEKLIEELDLQSSFLLAGHHSQPHKLYAEGTISILTSISEGFPYTIIESMSCGIPVVATDVGGVSEAITDGVDGFVCRPRDVLQIASKVVKLLQDRDLRNKMSLKARNKVLDKFTLEKIMSEYHQLYQSL